MIDLGKYTSDFIDENAIETLLSDSEKNVSATAVDDILAKAQTLKGLTISEVAMLLQVSDEATLQRLYKTAEMVKETIYGKRLVMFAPLYISNLCKNECTYCAFRVGNKALHRRVLRQDEINLETENLLDQGHKRILLVAGESYPKQGFQYVLDSIRTVYAAQTAKGNIRRINVNVAPLTLEEFAQLRKNRHLPDISGDLPPRNLPKGACFGYEKPLRLACNSATSRHGNRHRRCGYWHFIRPIRLQIRSPGAHATYCGPRKRLWRGATYPKCAENGASFGVRYFG